MIREQIAKLLLWLIKPALAPIIAELENFCRELLTRKVEWSDLEIMENNFIKVDKQLAKDAGKSEGVLHGNSVTEHKIKKLKK